MTRKNSPSCCSMTTTTFRFIWAQQPFFFQLHVCQRARDASRRGMKMQRARNAAPSTHLSCGFIVTRNSATNGHRHRCLSTPNNSLPQSEECFAQNPRCGAAYVIPLTVLARPTYDQRMCHGLPELKTNSIKKWMPRRLFSLVFSCHQTGPM